jgi:succinoglycan biosynthesis transport protein ExoP
MRLGASPAVQGLSAGGGQPDERLDLRAMFFALRRQRSIVLFIIALFLALAIVFTALQAPHFTASSSVVLNTTEDRVAPRKVDENAPSLPASDIADTEVEVIRSRELAATVAHALDLDRNPRFNAAFAQEGRLHRMLRIAGLSNAPKPNALTPQQRDSAIVGKLLDGLAVQRVGVTYAFNIAMTCLDPHDAQIIANEYATQYTKIYLNRKRSSDSNSVHFLGQRLEDLRNQAQADTARVQQYRIANNLLSTSGASLTEQEISSYNEGVATARAQAVEDQARLDTARGQLRGGSSGEDVGEALSSPVVNALRARQSEVSGRLANLEANFGPLYPDVQKAKNELADVNTQITAEIKRIISNLEAKVKVSSDRLASIQGSLGSARGQLTSNNRAMVGLDDLTRRAEASQQLYDSYLAQYKETVAQEGTERPEARVISYAELPPGPVSPKPLVNILLALIVGTAIGVIVAFVREMLYSGLTMPSDVETRLHLPCLGSIPLLKNVSPHSASPLSVIVQEPQSGFVEAFRALRTAISYAVAGRRQVLLVTSALPREGKTTLAMCLARLCAMNGERVVIVDVDIRQRGTSRRVLRKSVRPGLVELLRGSVTLQEVLIQDDLTGAWVLPIRERDDEIGDLLIGEEMDRVIQTLREMFGLVLLDAPPILPIADTRSLASKADAVIMVAKWRSTADRDVRAALNLLPSQSVPIAGLVLTQVDIMKQARFGYGDGMLYYERYKGYYS